MSFLFAFLIIQGEYRINLERYAEKSNSKKSIFMKGKYTMKTSKFKNWRLFATLALLGQTIGGAIGPTIAFADEITHPQTSDCTLRFVALILGRRDVQ